MKCIILRRSVLTAALCLLAACAMFTLVNHPAIVGASASSRQLPIYCVERDQKMLSISFDAAWGDGRLRSLGPKGSGDRCLFRYRSRHREAPISGRFPDRNFWWNA